MQFQEGHIRSHEGRKGHMLSQPEHQNRHQRSGGVTDVAIRSLHVPNSSPGTEIPLLKLSGVLQVKFLAQAHGNMLVNIHEFSHNTHTHMHLQLK